MTTPMMTCHEFQALLSDYLEAHALSTERRAAADAHAAGCAECAALVADLRTIVRDAGELPPLSPSRDLWRVIERQIEAPVVAISAQTTDDRRQAADGGRHHAARGPAWRRLAVAASILVVVTAGATYTLTRFVTRPELAALTESGSEAAVRRPPSAVPAARTVSRLSAEETFDREIALLRTIVDARRRELDSATVAVVEKNLKLIDRAIAESKTALAGDPASAFLMDRLNRAYDSKLEMLRGLATLPART